ncbi:hypothetical protein J2X11_000928 [Aeromicrobium panaciterrae]|uniref:Uncharacterized protein n=1 Tax=Aeromicrobium panaciterrae TaxID=363861 RepID=A0ABU1ULS3_9ACTN|nr:choice-of-anchor P family protein [Aeromicrobium panaciterrae]MDR7086089.1 hypothetical protein [Aeromicrobium panaciterrae]
MRLKLKMSAVASVVAVAALSVQGLSPAMAADPVPTATAAATPAVPEDVPGPPAEDTEGLVDVKIGDATVPVGFSLLEKYDVFQIARYDVSDSNYHYTGYLDQYDGQAVGVYIDANVADLLKITSRKIAGAEVPRSAGGNSNSHEVARFSLDGFFFAPGIELFNIESNAKSAPVDRFTNRPEAQAAVKISRLRAAGLVIEGIDVTARAGQNYYSGQTGDNTFSATTTMHVARLKSGTKEYQNYDVPPNTTYSIPGLGKVVLNEQKITELPGDRYAAKVNAVRITLSTASLGLPIGTNIYIGSAEAVVYE